MARWTWVVADTDGTARGELTEARSRRLSFRLDGPAEASFTIDGRHPQANVPQELATDLTIWRDGVRLYRGRIGQMQDQAGPNNHTLAVESADYRALLRRRILYTPLTFTQTDQEQIGWDLIAHTQAQVGGNAGITRRTAQTTGVLRDRTFPAGKNIGEALDQLSQVGNGFDWDISPELVWRVWYPQRGTTVPFPLDYGGRVRGFSRTVNPSNYANAVRVTGAEALTAETRQAAGLATSATGRFDAQHGLLDITQQAALAAHADGIIARTSTLTPAYTLHLIDGTWGGPDDLWLGDTAQTVLRSGRLDIVEQMRVHALELEVDEDGEEQVSVTVGAVEPDVADDLADMRDRLVTLERR